MFTVRWKEDQGQKNTCTRGEKIEIIKYLKLPYTDERAADLIDLGVISSE